MAAVPGPGFSGMTPMTLQLLFGAATMALCTLVLIGFCCRCHNLRDGSFREARGRASSRWGSCKEFQGGQDRVRQKASMPIGSKNRPPPLLPAGFLAILQDLPWAPWNSLKPKPPQIEFFPRVCNASCFLRQLDAPASSDYF